MSPNLKLNREAISVSLERGRANQLFRSSLKSSRSAAAIPPALATMAVQAPSGNHSNGTAVIENGIDQTLGRELIRALAFTDMEREPTVGTCAICGRPLTQVGPKGECLRCLADLGFLSGSQEPGRSETPRRLTPGPLKYDHFEVEVGVDGFPIELGSGAIAITYRARDTVLNSVVALKVIDRKVAKMPGVRSRFLREARAAAQIRHPNVARVSHYGEQDGECFYVMELVEGETLEAKVRREGPMPLALALEVIEQTARALAAAEACGVVHRDIKPSNIMLESDPSGCAPIVKVIDYGIAKILNPEAERGAEKTQPGFIGTPAFASPEQFAPSEQTKIDTRSDIYSLGVTFWYLLSGRVPFVGRTLNDIRLRQTEPLPIEQLKVLDVPARILALLKSMLGSRSERSAAICARTIVRRPPLLHKIQHRSTVAAQAIRTGDSGRSVSHRCDCNRSLAVPARPILRPVRTVDCGLAFRKSKRRQGKRLPGRGDTGRNPDPLIEDWRPKSDIAHARRSITRASLKICVRSQSNLALPTFLEGSVQKSAGTVRVNLQLIEAANNSPVWADTIDRALNRHSFPGK